MLIAALSHPLVLGACGAARELKPRPGETLPVAPYGAHKTPTRDQLIQPTTQERPARTDELLTASQARRSDVFDKPPPRGTTPAPLPTPAPDADPHGQVTPS